MNNQEFWETQAAQGARAGSQDLIAKPLEIEAIARFVDDGMNVLDVGCGNGVTALELAQRYSVTVLGLDSSPAMIQAANDVKRDAPPLKGRVEFQVGDVRQLPPLSAYDLAYTERTLINLPDWPSQRQAIIDILQCVRSGCHYVMCENSQDGLERLNALRRAVGLPSIVPPWHNRYLREAEVQAAVIPHGSCETSFAHTSTYYFLSRVVNAALAHDQGQEPDYNAPVNRLALSLPPLGDIGQGRIWVWRRNPIDA